MKKIISLITAIAVLCASFVIFITAIGAPQSSLQTQISVADRIRSFMLSNNPEALERVMEAHRKTISYSIDNRVEIATRGRHSTLESMLLAHGYDLNNFPLTIENFEKARFRDFNRTTFNEAMRLGGLVLEREGIISPKYSFSYYTLITNRFANQYADNFVFDQLISDEKFWVAVNKERNISRHYLDAGFNSNAFFNMDFYGVRVDNQVIDFLQNPEAIEEMVKRKISEEIIDCKIVFIWSEQLTEWSEEIIALNRPIRTIAMILYLRGATTDFAITLTDVAGLNRFEIYTVSEILNGIYSGAEAWREYAMVSDTQQALQYFTTIGALSNCKPTFTAEAEALQAMGLLHGNERGLDLLRPLTRIEAAAMLVRALGYANDNVPLTPYFYDMPYGNWGVRYANIALDRGITTGVGDGFFAPNAIITADQFATLVLRSSGEADFDWQQAIDMLIERGIITEENADTMDLFTRGDMAKILYEAMANGLL